MALMVARFLLAQFCMVTSLGSRCAPHHIKISAETNQRQQNAGARQRASCRTARCRHRAFLEKAAPHFEKLEAMLYNKRVYRLLAEKEVIPEVLEKLAVD
jgi:hypothetical protein